MSSIKKIKESLRAVAGVLAIVVCLPLFISMFVEMRKRI